jgi:sugar phosphate isomerase/epimerase
MTEMAGNILDKVSYHAVYDDSIMDALRYANSNGFSGIQLACKVPQFSFDGQSKRERRVVSQFVQRNEIRIVLHAADETASLLETNTCLQRGILNYYSALFDFAEELGAQMITIHLGTMPTWRIDTTPEEVLPPAALTSYLEVLTKNIEEVVRLAGERFMLVCENYKLDEIILDTLRPFLDDGRLFLCWDLAKTFDRQGVRDRTLEQYFWANLDRVKQVHLHDFRSDPPRQYRVIGTGFIDFMEFLPRLSQADIVDYCIEVRPREKALESLNALRQLMQT